MPSSSLDHKIPHSILFPKEPLFHISPMTIGCIYFVHDLSPGLDKLYARAIKCVISGYSRLQKVTNVTHMENCYYIYTDVTFFEEKFYSRRSIIKSHIIQEVFEITYLGSSIPLSQNQF